MPLILQKVVSPVDNHGENLVMVDEQFVEKYKHLNYLPFGVFASFYSIDFNNPPFDHVDTALFEKELAKRTANSESKLSDTVSNKGFSILQEHNEMLQTLSQSFSGLTYSTLTSGPLNFNDDILFPQTISLKIDQQQMLVHKLDFSTIFLKPPLSETTISNLQKKQTDDDHDKDKDKENES